MKNKYIFILSITFVILIILSFYSYQIYQDKHKEKISVVEKILHSNGLNKLFGSSYITSQMYLSDWRQKDFAKFQKKFILPFKNITNI